MTSRATAGQPGARSYDAKLIWLVVSLAAAGIVALLPTPDGLSPAGQRALAIMLLATLLWSTEALPLAATGLGCVVLLAVTGATRDLTSAFSGFAQPVPYFLYGVLVLALAARVSGLAGRVARWFLVLARGRPAALYWQLILSFVALPAVLPSASTRTGVQLPIYEEALGLLGLGAESRLGKAIMQGLAQLNRIGSGALLTGGVTPVTAAALLGKLSWTQWFVYTSVPVYVNLLLGAILVYLTYRPFEEPTKSARHAFEVVERSTETTPRASEWRVGLILALVSLLWLTDSINHLDPAVPALLGAVLLVTPRFGVLSWTEVERGVGVSSVFVIAASLSLARAVVDTGAAAWLTSGLVTELRPLADTPLLLVALLLVVSLIARALLANIAAYLTVLIPVVMALATEIGFNPLVCGLLVALVGDAVVYYAAQSSSSMLALESGSLRASDVLRIGFGMSAVAIVVGLTVALPYWAWLGQPLVVRH